MKSWLNSWKCDRSIWKYNWQQNIEQILIQNNFINGISPAEFFIAHFAPNYIFQCPFQNYLWTVSGLRQECDLNKFDGFLFSSTLSTFCSFAFERLSSTSSSSTSLTELQQRSSKILEERSTKHLLEVGNLYQSFTTLGLEPVSIVHYSRPGSSIKRPTPN